MTSAQDLQGQFGSIDIYLFDQQHAVDVELGPAESLIGATV